MSGFIFVPIVRVRRYTVIYRVRIIGLNEVPIKLKMNIYQQTIIVPLSVYTYL